MGKTDDVNQKELVAAAATEQRESVETAATEKKKIRVLQVFRDKYNKAVRYKVGQELEFDPERAEDLVKRKLAEYVDPSK